VFGARINTILRSLKNSRPGPRLAILAAATAAVLLCLPPSFAQGPQNILLVVNKKSKISRAIGEYYRERRGIPAHQVCYLRTFAEEEIDRETFDDEVRRPILSFLVRGKLEDRILYIVLTKGVPLKIKGSRAERDFASVDSELTLLYQDLAGVPRRLDGPARNPYFNANVRGRFVRFSHKDFPIYLVTRLDGYDLADVRALIDRAMAPASDGRFVLDESWNDDSPGNVWLRQAALELKRAGIPDSLICLENTNAFLTGEQDVMGYASWGSNDKSDHSRVLHNSWVKGALAAEYVSTNARTFEKPPKNWKTGQWSDPPATFFDGSPQSLIADYIHEGVTGISGYVYEPYLQACERPQILFPAYVQGLNLAESFYLAMPGLSWQTVVVGDPLVSPYLGTPLSPDESNPPQDPATGLPEYFAKFVSQVKAHK
jgi:uncharacterized protein (TIGR03790 family)